MADKKVDRSRRGRPLTPTQKMKSALSDPGTMNMAEPTHDKGKSALVDRFRQREERWRTEQSLHDQQAAREAQPARQKTAGAGGPEEAEEMTEGREAGVAEGPGEGGEP
jgi:hypothetical protein